MADYDDEEDDRKKWKKNSEHAGELVAFAVGAVLLGVVLLKSSVVVPAGTVGIKDFFGNVSDEVLSPGFHLINPLLNVHKLSIRTEELKESASVPSREGLSVNLEVSLLYSLQKDKAPEVYRTIGRDFLDVVVEPSLRSMVRGVTAEYDAKALYTSEREKIANEILQHLKPLLAERGVLAERILLRSITLPPVLAGAIEKKLEAEQQSEQMKFVLLKESQEAERKKIEASGIARYQEIVSKGISDALLRWKGIEATEKLGNSTNAKVILIGGGKDGLPLILGNQ